MSRENVEIVRRGMEAWLRGDMDTVLSTWDPEVIWDTSHFRDWPESSYIGADGVQRFLVEWLETWGDDYELDIEEVLPVPDGRVISLITHSGTGRQSGIPMELRMAQIVTLRNGKVTRFDNYDDRAEALEAVGLPE
jgi:ketosteroid isomerase-like protein